MEKCVPATIATIITRRIIDELTKTDINFGSHFSQLIDLQNTKEVANARFNQRSNTKISTVPGRNETRQTHKLLRPHRAPKTAPTHPLTPQNTCKPGRLNYLPFPHAAIPSFEAG